MPKEPPLTPIRRQYLDLKARYPGAILFFRLGDFYETFDEDAETVARELEITLTSRPMGRQGRIPLAGIPHHAAEGYLARLIAKGYRVAICEQMADPRSVKGLVPREVVRVVTPGTVVEPALLESKRNNYLVALAPGRGPGAAVGVAHIDITTSEFGVAQLDPARLAAEIARLEPAEIIAPEGWQHDLSISATWTPVPPGWSDPGAARDRLLEQFRVAALDGYGCAHLALAIAAAGMVVSYLEETQPGALAQVSRLFTYSVDAWMPLDPQTRRNLELFQSARSGGAEGSLLAVVDLTRTAMGGRLLRRWLERPLLDLDALAQRHDAVGWLLDAHRDRTEVLRLLGKIPDIERLLNRVRGGHAGPRELVSLRQGLELVPEIRALLEQPSRGGPAASLLTRLYPCGEVRDVIAAAIADDPSAAFEPGAVIRPGFSPDLDKLRGSAAGAREELLDLERKERERTGIRSLKVGYNRVFGYYIEVSNTHRRLVPMDYIRKQTLVGAERFYTPELKDLEGTILGAEDRLAELERELFQQVCAQVSAAGERLLETAGALAELDCSAALAEAAARYGYVRPQVDAGDTIEITGGRHPVVERFLDAGGFVPNDTLLSTHDCQIAVITGPNMSGKSTYLRQVALIVLMAQAGSFVPASAARIGLVDRIFTRVGAQDDLATGQSTFMVEMAETANILHHATPRSLIVLDEIGRGTSTYDGIAIAQSVVEYLHNQQRAAAKTLFATHYHELTALSAYLPRTRNFSFAVSEERGEVAFLRRIIPGGADRSYGIHVGRLAGLPEAVVRRAEEVLAQLEGARSPSGPRRRGGGGGEPALQLSLLDGIAELRAELAALEPDAMTPLEALTLIYQLRQRAREG